MFIQKLVLVLTFLLRVVSLVKVRMLKYLFMHDELSPFNSGESYDELRSETH